MGYVTFQTAFFVVFGYTAGAFASVRSGLTAGQEQPVFSSHKTLLVSQARTAAFGSGRRDRARVFIESCRRPDGARRTPPALSGTISGDSQKFKKCPRKLAVSLIFLILLSINLLIRHLNDCACAWVCDTMSFGGFP